MPECAFCSHTGKLSNEHIVSQWIGKLFPGRLSAWYSNAKGVDRRFTTDSMDWKAGVVCKQCNQTWMSKIESAHAKPMLTPLITGQTGIHIGKDEAHSIALFAFKTAVIVDHANSITPFFSRRERHAFRQHLSIPDNVRMWLCAYASHRGGGKVRSNYGQAKTPLGDHIQTYVCTCAFGNFAFQVLAVKQIGHAIIQPVSPIARLGVEFWPNVPSGFIWPPRYALRSADEFYAFADIWASVIVRE